VIQKHIVVVDGAWSGHHPVYVKAFAKVLLETGYRVSVLCPAPEDMTNWFAQAPSLEGAGFNAYYFSDSDELPGFIPRRLAPLVACLERWFHISNALKKILSSLGNPDMVFFAWLDSYLSSRYVPAWLIDWRFPFAWSGLYFHPRHHRIKQSLPVVAKYLPLPECLVAKSRLACSLAVLDAGVIHKLRARLCEKQVFVFPDFSDEIPPCEHYHLVDEIKGKARNRKIIGLLGGLARRKGLLTLLKIAQQPMAQDWYFVFAGRLVEQTFSKQELKEIKLFFDEPRDNCFAYFDQIPTDAQFNAMVNVCDVIFAVYQDDFLHSSNLVTKAAAYGKNLLVSSGGYMEEVVRQYELGEIVPAGDVQAALVSLSRLTAAGSARGCSTGMRAYSMEQSQDKLRQALLGLVENCIGSAIDGGMDKQYEK
jgi:hypothetical protein